MSAYTPDSSATLVLLYAVLVFEILSGYFLQRRKLDSIGVSVSWAMALGFPLLISWHFAGEPAGFRVLAIAFPLYFGMKGVTAVNTRLSGPPLSFSRWLIFCLTWPGMRPQLFKLKRRELRGKVKLLAGGIPRLMLGILVILLARYVWRQSAGETNWVWMACGLMMVGLSFALHFGIFNIMAAFHRWFGFDCRALFRAPYKAKTVSEFWSQRWNLAFSEMISIAVHRPVSRKYGLTWGLLAGFLCSGFFHELAISFPVNRGYGLPMLYFMIQGGFVILEGRTWMKPYSGRLLTAIVILVPAPLLFHPWFLQGAVIPLLQ